VWTRSFGQRVRRLRYVHRPRGAQAAGRIHRDNNFAQDRLVSIARPVDYTSNAGVRVIMERPSSRARKDIPEPAAPAGQNRGPQRGMKRH